MEARYLLDCSGRQTILGNFFKLKKSYDHLQKFSVFAHFENVDRDSGIDATLLRMVRGLDRWFWLIPLTATRTSIGVVMDTATFRAMKLSPEAALGQMHCRTAGGPRANEERLARFARLFDRRFFLSQSPAFSAIAGCSPETPPVSSIRFLAAAFSWQSCRLKRPPTHWMHVIARRIAERGAFSRNIHGMSTESWTCISRS